MLCRISDIRIVAVLGAIAVLAVWAIANTDHVEVDWIADTTTAPLIVVIGALGFIIGFSPVSSQLTVETSGRSL